MAAKACDIVSVESPMIKLWSNHLHSRKVFRSLVDIHFLETNTDGTGGNDDYFMPIFTQLDGSLDDEGEDR